MEQDGGDFDFEIDPDEIERNVQEAIASLGECPKADVLSQNELRRELNDRGIQSKGFFNDDARRLQQEFDKEFKETLVTVERASREGAARNARQKAITFKREEQERELKDEQDALAKDEKISFWLELMKSNHTPSSAVLVVNDVTCRAICKTLALNHSLLSLDLCRSSLSDAAGVHIGNMLKRNRSLVKLELDSNSLGPKSCIAIGDALQTNDKLTYLSLDSNPLTSSESDFSGMKALGEMIANNSTLTCLNLWRTSVGPEGGRYLASAMKQNDTIIALEVQNNNVGMMEMKLVMDKLEDNMQRFDDKQHQLRMEREEKKKEEDLLRKKKEIEDKDIEEKKWIEDQRKIREEKRLKQAEDDARKKKEAEEQRLREAQAREAAILKAEAEASKKKKKKKGKKKK